MDYVEEVRTLLAHSKYHDAARILDNLISKEMNNDELWYLRGIVAMRLRAYESAQEYFERALTIKKKNEYYRMRGMAYFETFQIEEAVESFENALSLDENDLYSNFFIGICETFRDNPQGSDYLKKAARIDPKKTKQLMMNFHSSFFAADPKISDVQKKQATEKIGKFWSS